MNSGKSTTLSGLGGLVIPYARPLLAIFLALLVSAVFILARGSNPIEAYKAMLLGAFGSKAALANTGVRATPLLLGGLAVAIGWQAGLLNVGIEGQIYLGGIFSAAVAITPIPGPAWLHLLFAVIAGFIGGALWGLIPAFLKAYRGVSEIVVTLMLNYVAIQLTSLVVHEPSPLAKKDAFYPQSPTILPSAQLPILIKGTSLHAGLIIGIVLGVLIYFILKYTNFGFRIRMLGGNINAARYAGVRVRRLIFVVILISAGFGGLGGVGEVLGLKLALYDYFVVGLGYDSIAVALMANGNPLGVIATAIFFGALRAGAGKMQVVAGIETPIAAVIQALAVLFVIAFGFAEVVRVSWREKKEQVGKEVIADGE
jgi:simple sugar transport system permease protein